MARRQRVPLRRAVEAGTSETANSAITRPPPIEVLKKTLSKSAHLRPASREPDGITRWSMSPQDRLFHSNDVGRGGLSSIMTFWSAQEAWRDVPLATIIGDDRDGSFVVAGENALDQAMIAGLETHSVADTEIEHAGMRTHLLEETQPFDNPVVEVNQFSLTQLVNIDFVMSSPNVVELLRVTRR